MLLLFGRQRGLAEKSKCGHIKKLQILLFTAHTVLNLGCLHSPVADISTQFKLNSSSATTNKLTDDDLVVGDATNGSSMNANSKGK
jgi:hypothetical protein